MKRWGHPLIRKEAESGNCTGKKSWLQLIQHFLSERKLIFYWSSLASPCLVMFCILFPPNFLFRRSHYQHQHRLLVGSNHNFSQFRSTTVKGLYQLPLCELCPWSKLVWEQVFRRRDENEVLQMCDRMIFIVITSMKRQPRCLLLTHPPSRRVDTRKGGRKSKRERIAVLFPAVSHSGANMGISYRWTRLWSGLFLSIIMDMAWNCFTLEFVALCMFTLCLTASQALISSARLELGIALFVQIYVR